MPTVTFGGLASGLDTNSIIAKLVAVEKLPENQINQHISDANSKISILGDMTSKLTALQTAADALNRSSLTHPVSATSNNTAIVSVTGSTATSQGVFSMVVNHLAQAQSTISNPYLNNNAGVAGTGTIDIATGANMAVTVSWDNTNTLTDVANKINSAGAGVTASVLFDGTNYQLMVNSKTTGIANAISFTNSTGTDLGFNVGGHKVVPPLDADFTMNNVHVTRSTNVITDVIPGVTFQLNAATGVSGPTSLTLAPDVAGLQSKVKAVVDAYNSVATAVHKQVSYTGTGTTQMGGNTLFGDSSMQALEQQMNSLIATSYAYGGGLSITPRTLGMTLQADGTIAFDANKFATAVTSDPDAADHLLNGSGVTGLVSSIDNLVTNFTQAGTGVLVTAQASLRGSIKSYNDDISRIEDRASALQSQLTKQFTAMEQATSQLQSQAAYLSQIKSY